MSLRAGGLLRSRGRWLGGIGVAAAVDRPTQATVTGRPISRIALGDPVLTMRPEGAAVRSIARAMKTYERRLRE